MVKTGKEAHVYHAAAPEDPEDPSSGKIRDVAVKIFKTTLNEFGNRAAYVDGDPRCVSAFREPGAWNSRGTLSLFLQRCARNRVCVSS